MLLRQYCGGHKESDLLSILYSLESRPDGDLRLTVADIAANQPVHDLRTFHVTLDFINRPALVVRFLIGKQLLKLLLPDRIRAELKSLRVLPGCIQIHKFLRNFGNGALHPRFGPVPILAAQLVQFRLFHIGIRVFLDHVEVGRQHVKAAAALILDAHIVLHDVINFDFLNAAVNAQSVTFMYHIIARRQILKAGDAGALVHSLACPFLFLPPEDICLRDHSKADHRILISTVCISVHHQYLGWQHLPVRILREHSIQVPLLKIRSQSQASGFGR